MGESFRPTRRRVLGGLGAACSAAAFPLITPVVHAAMPGENRVVVILLRGAMDGLELVHPWGAPEIARLRPSLARRPGDGAEDLDGFFALAAEAGGLMELWRRGELAFAHAVSTPYRDRRSHFDGQDFLENGGGDPGGLLTEGRDGWLNRMLTLVPGAEARTAIAVGRDNLRILDGAAPAGSWSPTAELRLAEDERRLLTRLYARDPLFREAFASADALASMSGARAAKRETGRTLGAFVARMMREDARVAAFSLGGWDTHRGQAGAFRGPAGQLAEAILSLREGLGPDRWARTTVMAVTEFGRTAAENGNRGTDHGTAGVMVFAGGTLSRARVHGRWPGIGEADLYERRDLMPTDDLRRLAGWVLGESFGLERGAVERIVFPGVEMGADPRILA